MTDQRSYSLDFEGARHVYSVSALNREARLTIERGLGTVWVEGEISNFSRPSSGHMYWSLKDSDAQVRCAMFRQLNRNLAFEPGDGRQVLVRARVSLYEARGDFQLIVDYMEEAGEGVLRRRFELLKQKLETEGLFDPARKRPLPALPARIGIITSPTGAAIRDVLIALRRRFPPVCVLIYPTGVQGDGAADSIVRALGLAGRRRECDLLILTRGGGSLEDLWPFNEERVARAVAAVPIPIIVGVGHETDFTIAEFAADLRAPTPSQAAELAVPEKRELDRRLEACFELLRRFAARRLREDRRLLDTIAHRLGRAHPGVTLQTQQQRLDELEGRLMRSLAQSLAGLRRALEQIVGRFDRVDPRRGLDAVRQRAERARDRMGRGMHRRIERLALRTALAERSLAALDPLATLERGYAIVSRTEDGTILTDSADVAVGARIDVKLAAGGLGATVESTTKTNSDR